MPKRKFQEIDVSDVPDLDPILKDDACGRFPLFEDNTRSRPAEVGASKYMGVYYEKSTNKWKAQIMIQGRVRHLGFFEDEQAAARYYAKAAYKFKSMKKPFVYGGMDLSGVPKQPLLTKRNGTYQGVKKCRTKWQARIGIAKNGETKMTHLGTFDTAEEAAEIYAKANFLLNGSEDSSSS